MKYSIDKSAPRWIISFHEGVNVMVRMHTSREWAPYMDDWFNEGKNCGVDPGQWVEFMVDGMWTYVTEADHR